MGTGRIEKVKARYLDETAPVLFFLLAADGRIVEANRYAERHVGRRACAGRFQGLVVDFHGTFELRRMAQEPDEEHVLHLAMESGLPQSYFVRFVPVEEHLLVFCRLDADEMETLRREMLSMNQELANLTRELHKKNARLRSLHAEKNRFLGMAAHDLRKPIGLIMTYAEFLLDEAGGALDAEHLDFVRTIHTSCTSMKRLVDDFLDVSAIEAGKFEMDLHPCAMREVVQKALVLNRLQAERKGIDLKVLSTEDPSPMLMDGAKIEQAVTNLVANAVEHSSPGDTVTISIFDEADHITVSVTDAGPGIPAKVQKNLFQPFEKAGVPKTDREKGTGLGLAITRKIVEAHQGRIRVESRAGEGTTVSFSLPREIGVSP